MEKLLTELDEECTDLKLDQAHQLKKEIQRATIELRETIPVSEKEALSIMRELFYGSEAIHTAFGFIPKKSTNIPYSRETLKQAYQNGERLVLRIATDDKGKPMTMQHMNEIMEPRMDRGTRGKLLRGVWYQAEKFYTTDSLTTEWKLIGGNLLPNSTDKNYIQQTRLLRDHLVSIQALTDEEKESCTDEILRELSEEMGVNFDSGLIINKKLNDLNRRKVAGKLADLSINKNHRRTPGEMFFDRILHLKILKDSDYLESKYDWSACVTSSGSIVYLGGVDLDSSDAGMDRGDATWKINDVGVVPVR